MTNCTDVLIFYIVLQMVPATTDTYALKANKWLIKTTNKVRVSQELIFQNLLHSKTYTIIVCLSDAQSNTKCNGSIGGFH